MCYSEKTGVRLLAVKLSSDDSGQVVHTRRVFVTEQYNLIILLGVNDNLPTVVT